MKIKKSLKINKTELLVIYKKEDILVEKIIQYIKSTINKLEKFYQINIPKFTIELIYSRKEFDQKIGWKTPDWLVAFVKNQKINIFSPLVIEKISEHRKSEINKIITHEICHIFNQKINKNCLMFFDEGVALFLAGQKKDKPKQFSCQKITKIFFRKDINNNQFAKKDGYKLSYWFVKNYADKYSQEKILDLIKLKTVKDIQKELNNLKIK